jgi:hypothetical protein
MPIPLCQFIFVKITLLGRNHMKMLIVSGTFIFQIYLERNLMYLFIKSRYIDLNENEPDVDKPKLLNEGKIYAKNSFNLRHAYK